jgi:hypothetical protein
MLLASRAWVTFLGLLSILSVIPHWLGLEALAAERGVEASGIIGRANVRADMGGIFLAIGILALIASYTRSTIWLLATILVPACALLGRFASLLLDGYEPAVLPPIVIEVVVIASLAFAYRLWTRAAAGDRSKD